jgi:hypothetical protein
MALHTNAILLHLGPIGKQLQLSYGYINSLTPGFCWPFYDPDVDTTSNKVFCVFKSQPATRVDRNEFTLFEKS